MTDHTIRRLPGTTPPEAAEIALTRLVDAMQHMAATMPRAAELYAAAFKLALVAAPYGTGGAATTKLLAAHLKRLEAYVATLPNEPPTPPVPFNAA